MPGLKPIYRPRFTSAQVAEAKRIAKKRSESFSVVQRAKLVLLLHKRPDLENPIAARQLGQHENWVRYWRKRWATEGFSLTDKEGRGRKPAFSPSRPRTG